MRHLAFLLVVALTLTVAAGPPAVDGQLAHTLLISGGTLIDGTGREPVRDAVIVIQGSKIVTVTMAGAGPAPPDAQRIDAHGKWIIPRPHRYACALLRMDGAALSSPWRDHGTGCRQ